jgi:hypothetical protein
MQSEPCARCKVPGCLYCSEEEGIAIVSIPDCLEALNIATVAVVPTVPTGPEADPKGEDSRNGNGSG